MSDEKASLFDLEFHEEATAGHYSVMRVPGGWIYSSISVWSSCFVPEPPIQFEEQKGDELDQELIDFFNYQLKIFNKDSDFDPIKVNRFIRQLLRRSQPKEPEL